MQSKWPRAESHFKAHMLSWPEMGCLEGNEGPCVFRVGSWVMPNPGLTPLQTPPPQVFPAWRGDCWTRPSPWAPGRKGKARDAQGSCLPGLPQKGEAWGCAPRPELQAKIVWVLLRSLEVLTPWETLQHGGHTLPEACETRVPPLCLPSSQAQVTVHFQKERSLAGGVGLA